MQKKKQTITIQVTAEDKEMAQKPASAEGDPAVWRRCLLKSYKKGRREKFTASFFVIQITGPPRRRSGGTARRDGRRCQYARCGSSSGGTWGPRTA